MELVPIAYIHSEFPEKFGVPRQSGLAGSLCGTIVLEPEYRSPDALRGLEGFSHLWLIWGFSANRHEQWQPTVRPPRLGGNERMGVFATRSPYRPNPLGLSCVEIECVDMNTSTIYVRGADLVDGTPIYDIKPYIRYADSRPDAVCGYVDCLEERHLDVVFPESAVSKIMDPDVREALRQTLSLDPRPSYHNDSSREYGLSFAGFNVRFVVDGEKLIVISVE